MLTTALIPLLPPTNVAPLDEFIAAKPALPIVTEVTVWAKGVTTAALYDAQ